MHEYIYATKKCTQPKTNSNINRKETLFCYHFFWVLIHELLIIEPIKSITCIPNKPNIFEECHSLTSWKNSL